MTAPLPLKWRPCEFKACGRTEHIGRARWNAKLGGWEVREMRAGYPAAPSLYGPSAVYSIRWLTKTERDASVSEAQQRHEERKLHEARERIERAIFSAIASGCTTAAAICNAAVVATGSIYADVATIFAEQKDACNIVRKGRRWVVNDDMPF
jgi:hypothetical protein